MTVLFEGSIADSEAMEQLGVRLATVLGAGDLVVLTGPLGAGKTTLTRGLGRGLGVRGQVASPTFVLARTHPAQGPGGAPLVHVDAYRLGSPAELDDLDLDYASSVVVVEWGAGMLDGVAESWLEVTIARPTGAPDDGGDRLVAGQDPADADRADATPEEPRTLRIESHGPRWRGVDLPA